MHWDSLTTAASQASQAAATTAGHGQDCSHQSEPHFRHAQAQAYELGLPPDSQSDLVATPSLLHLLLCGPADMRAQPARPAHKYRHCEFWELCRCPGVWVRSACLFLDHPTQDMLGECASSRPPALSCLCPAADGSPDCRLASVATAVQWDSPATSPTAASLTAAVPAGHAKASISLARPHVQHAQAQGRQQLPATVTEQPSARLAPGALHAAVQASLVMAEHQQQTEQPSCSYSLPASLVDAALVELEAHGHRWDLNCACHTSDVPATVFRLCASMDARGPLTWLKHALVLNLVGLLLGHALCTQLADTVFVAVGQQPRTQLCSGTAHSHRQVRPP